MGYVCSLSPSCNLLEHSIGKVMIYLNLGSQVLSNIYVFICKRFYGHLKKSLDVSEQSHVSVMFYVWTLVLIAGPCCVLILVHRFDCLGCKISKPIFFFICLICLYLPSQQRSGQYFFWNICKFPCGQLKNYKSVKIVIKVKILGTKQWCLRIFLQNNIEIFL